MSIAYLDSLRNNIRRRTETDYIMPLRFPFIPLILNLITVPLIYILTPYIYYKLIVAPTAPLPFIIPPQVSVAIICASINNLLVLLGAIICYITNIHVLYKWINPLVSLVAIIFAIINFYVLYKWIKRRNEHFKRQLMVYRDIMSLLREISRERGIDISTQIALINREISEAEIKETKKNAVLWAILVLLSGNWISPILPPICMVILYVYPVLPPIGIVNLYIYHFLTKDFFVHERREDRIVTRIQEALGILGTRFAYRRYYEIPHRNTILYAILTIITLGIFSLYWVYVITKDPNEHFLEQRRWEDAVVSAIEQLTLP